MAELTAIETIRALAGKGIGRRRVEATLRRKLTEDELGEFYRAQTVRQLRIEQKKAAGPKSTAERVREFVARGNEVGEINPKPRHRRLKERCRYDLEAFGWYYCRRVLKHRAPVEIREGLIKDIQNAILSGGQFVKQYGRGAGKTTWIVFIAITWAILYGHRRYPVIISATGKLAKKNLKMVKKLLTRTKAIAQDFPEIAVPLQAIGGIAQRAASQTYCGQPTDVEWASDQIVLPMVRGKDGRPLGPGCGAIVGSVGIGGAVRGANEDGQRPDYLIFDDPQTKKIAHSPKMVGDVLTYIHQDALMLAGHDRVLSAFVTITPQCYGDVATELSSASKYPWWSVTVEPFVKRMCPRWDELVAEFVDAYTEDAANHDTSWSISTAWYKEHRDEFAGVDVIDPEQYDHNAEVDVVHHVLNLRAKLGEASFNAEVMMKVSDADSELEINADKVANCLNGAPRCTLPVGTDCAVAFCDVNIRKGKGLSWGVVAFGPGRVAAVVAYGRYPERGPLVPPNSSDLVRNKLVAAGMRQVITKVAGLPLRDAQNRRVRLTAFGFDRGYLPDVVHRVLRVIRSTVPLGFPIVAVRGFPWNKFGTRKKDMLRRGDHIFATRSQYGQYLAEMAPYWREKMQSGFLETPLMPGSLSLYGSDPVKHFEFANEIAAEKLVRKYVIERKGVSETAWDWSVLGDNHYCDVLTGAFAVASWYHCYDNLSKVIDAEAKTGVLKSVEKIEPHVTHQDDLFNPMKNEAVVENAGYDRGCEKELAKYIAEHGEDQTEGTGETVDPHPSEVENVTDPLTEASPVPRKVGHKFIHKLSKKVHKFRKGRYRR